jgi:hypothetical protein
VARKTKIMQILDELEQGLIDVEQAARRLESEAAAREPLESGEVPAKAMSEDVWLIPFSIGLAATVMGAWLASLGGWWWLCAGPSLLAGILLVTLASWSRRAPWIHVRVRTRRRQWPRRLEIRLPVPMGVAAWAVRTFARHTDARDGSGAEELLAALNGVLSWETPLYVQVDADEHGEHVEVRIG